MSTDMHHTAVTSAAPDAPSVFIPAELEDHIIRGNLRLSQIQVLFAWLRTERRQGGGIPGGARPFRTTQIAAACELTVGPVKHAKADLVALGILSEQHNLGRPSSVALKIGNPPAENEPSPQLHSEKNSHHDASAPPNDAVRNLDVPEGEGGGGTAVPFDPAPTDRTPSSKRNFSQTASRPETAPSRNREKKVPGLPGAAQGGVARHPVPDNTPSAPYNIHAHATSTSSSMAFKNSKNLVPPSSFEMPTRVENSTSTPIDSFPQDLTRQHDTQAKQARKLYRLFCEKCPAEVAGTNAKRVPNVGEYLQVRRFLQQAVPETIISDAILTYRSSARHFGLIRSMILKQLKTVPEASPERSTQADERRQAESEIREAMMQVASGSDFAPPSPAAYEGRPNADAYRPVDQDLIRRWRAMYPDEA